MKLSHIIARALGIDGEGVAVIAVKIVVPTTVERAAIGEDDVHVACKANLHTILKIDIALDEVPGGLAASTKGGLCAGEGKHWHTFGCGLRNAVLVDVGDFASRIGHQRLAVQLAHVGDSAEEVFRTVIEGLSVLDAHVADIAASGDAVAQVGPAEGDVTVGNDAIGVGDADDATINGNITSYLNITLHNKAACAFTLAINMEIAASKIAIFAVVTHGNREGSVVAED